MDPVERFRDKDALQKRIEQFRKGDCRIRIEDGGGGAQIREVVVRQKRHSFIFGCNAFGWGKMETRKAVRFDWTKQEMQHHIDPIGRVEGFGADYGDGGDADDMLYTARFRALFNLAVLPFYERSIEPVEGTVNYHRLGRMVDWARENQLMTKGHPLSYLHRGFSAPWLLKKSPEDFWKYMERRVNGIMERFGDKIDLWDYANEIRTSPLPGCESVYDAASKAYRLARAAAPKAVLTLNEEDGKVERADLFIDVLKRMKDEGILPDIFGIQSHYWSMEYDDIRYKLAVSLDKYEQLDIPIHFTETTFVPIPNAGMQLWEAEAVQAQNVVEFYSYIFSRPQVEAIIWWDLCDRHSFCNMGGLLRDDLSAKPAYHALDHLINREWRTTASLSVEQGEGRFRGFYGTYEAEIVLANGTRLYDTFELPKDPADAEVTVTLRI